jgi:hypothetical protein
MTGALAIFIALQVLGWLGYQTPPEGAIFFQQSPRALLVIRVLIGPFAALLLFSAVAMAWFYPLTRETPCTHSQITGTVQEVHSRFVTLTHLSEFLIGILFINSPDFRVYQACWTLSIQPGDHVIHDHLRMAFLHRVSSASQVWGQCHVLQG